MQDVPLLPSHKLLFWFPMLPSEPICKLFHIKLFLTDVDLFVRKKRTSNTTVFNGDTKQNHSELLPKSVRPGSTSVDSDSVHLHLCSSRTEKKEAKCFLES